MPAVDMLYTKAQMLSSSALSEESCLYGLELQHTIWLPADACLKETSRCLSRQLPAPSTPDSCL